MGKISIAMRERDQQKVIDLKHFALPDVQEQLRLVEARIEQDRQERIRQKSHYNGEYNEGKEMDAFDLDNMEEDKGQKDLLSEIVDENKIAEIVSRWTGIPVTKLNASEKQRLLHLNKHYINGLLVKMKLLIVWQKLFYVHVQVLLVQTNQLVHLVFRTYRSREDRTSKGSCR